MPSRIELPIGTLTGQDLNSFFESSIGYHIDSFFQLLAQFEPKKLYSDWRTIIRTIDELINIPLELSDEAQSNYILQFSFGTITSVSGTTSKNIHKILADNFDEGVAVRFGQFAFISTVINETYKQTEVWNLLGHGQNMSTTLDCIAFYQSRRAYYQAILTLIPQIAKGKKKVSYIETLNEFQYALDTCLLGITTAYYNLLLNHCLDNFEVKADGKVAKGNFVYKYMEGFFLQPERLSLLEQMEFRPDLVAPKEMLPIPRNQIFSFSEVANAMALFESGYEKYGIAKVREFNELNSLFYDLAIFLRGDYNLEVDEETFNTLRRKYPSLQLSKPTNDYFDALNSFAPFQKSGSNYYSTVVVLTKFVYRTLSTSLQKNKTFQINSGFIFEDKIQNILKDHDYKPTGITRINHKEFDLITIKEGKVYNFQCKNNFIDISRVDYNYKKIGRYNKFLENYYKKALEKEKNREELILRKLEMTKIEHFVISRFPIITKHPNIISFNTLEEWIKRII